LLVVSCCFGRRSGEEGDQRVEVVVKEREERTKTNRDGIDVRLKLRYPSKITFDTASY